MNIMGTHIKIDTEELTETPVKAPKIEIDFFDKVKLLKDYDKEKQVIVHCSYNAGYQDVTRIRIWPTTFLYYKGGHGMSNLLRSYNIANPPRWTQIAPGNTHQFTLVFSALPKSCKKFDLVERAHPLAFVEKNIKRTANDVYYIDMFDPPPF